MALQKSPAPQLTYESLWPLIDDFLVSQGNPATTRSTYKLNWFRARDTLRELGLAEETPQGMLLTVDPRTTAAIIASWRKATKQGGAPLYADTSMTTMVGAYGGCLKAAVQLGLIEESPMRHFSFKRTKRVKVPRRLSLREVRNAFAFTEAHPDYLRYTLYLALSVLCGLRAGEMRALTFGAALSHPTMLVVRIPGSGPKGHHERMIARPQWVTELLLRLQARTPHAADEDYVFQGRGRDGRTPLSRDRIHRLWAVPLKQVIPDWHFHLGRHFATMYLLSQGVPVPQTADFLGHQDWATTAQYAEPFAQDSRPARKAMEELSERLRPEGAHEDQEEEHDD